MLEDNKQNGSTDNEDEKFFEDVLDDPETKEKPDESKGGVDETEEEKQTRLKEEERVKNKNAEEARKRREAEAKADKALKEKEAKDKETADKKSKAKEEQIGSLGKQLDTFKKEFPKIDLKELDDDKAFKKFINGRLLGKQSFTELYTEFLQMKVDLSGKTKEQIEESYRKKADSGSGSSVSQEQTNPNDVYSEEEFNKLEGKIPYMSDEEYDAVADKFNRSYSHYSK